MTAGLRALTAAGQVVPRLRRRRAAVRLPPRRARPAPGRACSSSRCRCWPPWWWRAPATGSSCARRLDPPRVEVGSEATVTLRLENVTRLPTGLLLIEDTAPVRARRAPPVRARPGGAARRPGDRLQGPLRSARPVRHRPAVGAHHRPVRPGRADPVVHDHRHARGDPRRWWRCRRCALSGEWAGGGDSRTRSVAAAGDDDVAPREYRQGDDLRRVHWRSTARYGELMVRREEQQWQSRGALLLDTRRYAHRGEGPRSSFEVAVSAAASIGVHLAREGLGLRLVTDQGAAAPHRRRAELVAARHARGGAAERGALAGVRHRRAAAGRRRRADRGRARRARRGARRRALARLRHGSVTGVAVLLDVATWERPRARRTTRSTRRREAVLAGAGWRVVRLPAGASLAAVWPDAAHGPQVTAREPDHRRCGMRLPIASGLATGSGRAHALPAVPGRHLVLVRAAALIAGDRVGVLGSPLHPRRAGWRRSRSWPRSGST